MTAQTAPWWNDAVQLGESANLSPISASLPTLSVTTAPTFSLAPISTASTPMFSATTGFAGSAIRSITPLLSPKNWAELIATGAQGYAAIQAARAQRKITDLNIKRITAGLDPLDAAAVAATIPRPGVTVGLDEATRAEVVNSVVKPVLIGAGVLGALLLLNQSRSSSPRRP